MLRLRSSGVPVKQAVSSVAAGVRAVAEKGTSIIPRPRVNLHPLRSAGITTSRALVAAASGTRAFTVAAVAALHWRWQRFKRARARREVIRRVWDGMSGYLDGLLESEPAVRQPFVLGLAAAWDYHWNQAIGHFQEARTRASDAQSVPLLNQIGLCYRMQGRPQEALREFSESARLAERHKDGRGRASALCNIGAIRHEHGERNKALKQLREGLDAARTSDDELAARVCLANIGNILYDKGRLNDALESHHEALEISERMGDGPGVTDCLGSIASILRDRNELDQAFEHYSQALDTARGIRYELGVAVELSGLAGVCFDKGELDRALGLHEEALATSRRIGYRLGVATELGNIGLILVKKEAHEQAVPYLAESLTLFQTIGATTGPTQALTGLAQCHDSLGRERIRELLGQALPTDKLVADMLERIDQLRRHRPRQKRSQPVR